jgi:hypothetical protein
MFLAEGHIHNPLVKLAFSQHNLVSVSTTWGVAPGYDEFGLQPTNRTISNGISAASKLTLRVTISKPMGPS